MSTEMLEPKTTPAQAPASTKRGPRVIRRGGREHTVLLGIGAVLAVLVILWGGQLDPFNQGQLTRVAIFAIAIVGLNIATGYIGLLSVGHSAFFGLGAYTTGVLVVKYEWDPLMTIPAALVVCLVVGLLVGLPALRIRGLYLAMVTLAFGVAFPEIVAHFDDLTGGAEGMTIRRQQLRPPEWSGFTLGERSQWVYWLCVVVLLIVMWIAHNMVRGRYGMAMIAVRENEIAAASSGINIAVMKVTAFGVSGAVTGVAGSLFAMYIGSLFAEGSFTLLAGITLLIGLVIGGEATRSGPLVGALAVVFVPYYAAELGQGQVAAVLFAVVLIFVIFVAPAGIVGGIAKAVRKVVVVTPRIPRKPEGTQQS
ncbi:branched-chain amino acid ABC transporter permease [Aeromicrobium endophyticum]|uniref:Branched-chain amino acid ABC transporter permease n=1 Tax=Aeromicrobium endophyticum TaxID=2292704 RepID=A0A371P9Y0_9ACTN|nr:branched-chain amino acid ABC transporter permease [Aeromicrobium endophyticum]REK72712.1 branched-chain amino acid ABC transporter permease [Aeromicrobium endophyticum]